jgi:biotin carboxyl carrier protein
MRYFIDIDGHETSFDVSALPEGGSCVRRADGRLVPVDVAPHAAGYTILVANRVFDLVVAGEPPELTVYANGTPHRVRIESARSRSAVANTTRHSALGPSVISSPMPGKVVKVLVEPGQRVEKEDALVVVEAMKMENEILAERSGTVEKVLVSAGDAVEAGAELAILSP